MTFGSFGKSIVMLVCRSGKEPPDAAHPLALLRASRKRPCCRTAEQRDELASFH
jgi:hypothetical protein